MLPRLSRKCPGRQVWFGGYNGEVHIPGRLPALRLLTILLLLYSAVWIALEGSLLRVSLLAGLLALVLLGRLWQRFAAGHTLRLAAWLALCGGSGLLWGAGSAVLALLLMAVKTGLHAHGPEFSVAEINWMVDQMPVWGGLGLVVGLGLGLLAAGWGAAERDTP